MRKTVVLDIPCEKLIQLLNESWKIRVHRNHIRKIMTIPHFGFGLWGLQIVTGALQPVGDRTEILLRVRPSIAALAWFLILIGGSIVTVILTFLGKCVPWFCILIILFTAALIALAVWEGKTCLEKFSRSVMEKHICTGEYRL